LSLIDARTFRFMVDAVPNFATFIMAVLACRIRGMSKALLLGKAIEPPRDMYAIIRPIRIRFRVNAR